MENKTLIMVVDDEIFITELVKRILQGAGYSVSVANDGKSALSMFEKVKPT